VSMSGGEQHPADGAADVAGASGDQDLHDFLDSGSGVKLWRRLCNESINGSGSGVGASDPFLPKVKCYFGFADEQISGSVETQKVLSMTEMTANRFILLLRVVQSIDSDR